MTGEEIRANKATVTRVLKAYAQGDLAPLFEAIADDVEWTSNTVSENYRFGGRRTGRAGVLEALSLIAVDYAVRRYELKEVTAEGDTIWSYVDAEFMHRRTNKPIAFVLASRWKFRDGKIVAFEEFFDTAAVLEQEGRITKIAAQ